MSIHLMTVVWKMPIPAGQKMVLLALCDNANDQGECYPSVSMLTEKCSMSQRSIFSHIDWLEKHGILTRENRSGRSTIYHIDPCKFCTPANSAPLQNLHTTPATVAPPPLQNLHTTPANSAPITITEPSIEPSREPSKRTKAKQGAFALPVWIEKESWDGFVAMRKAIRKPLTEQAMVLTVRELEKLVSQGENANAVLEQSIMNSWQGVFPTKGVQRIRGPRQSPESAKQEATQRAYERLFGQQEKEIIGEATRL